MSDNMVYVAADPNQIGAAWAICSDKPEYKKDTAESIAEWIRRGATVMHVTKEVGCEMLRKWVRPVKPVKQKELELF